MAEIINDSEFNGIQIIKNFDPYIGKCTVDNLELLSEQLKLYYTHPSLIEKYSPLIKDLIQLLFKYLMDGNKNSEEDIIGCFKDEDIFNGIKNIYYLEDYDVNCIIIQSLSILIVNIVKSKAFLYCILSNNFVNDLLLIDFSKYDDEYFSYYVNFLKSLVIRIDENTFQLFYNERTGFFPLIDCALNLYNYSNSMTRTVVNNIILQILKCDMEKIYEYFTILPSVNYFSFISLRMKDIIIDLSNDINNLDPYEDLTDLTMFINDLLSLEHPKINFIVRNSIFYYFLLPEIFESLFVLIYGDDLIKNKDKRNKTKKKESIIILCLITFLINIKDETIMYIILHLLLSEYIPEKIEKYILHIPESNPFYHYKWNKNFQKDIDFGKFMSLNYSNKFLGTFLNSDNYYLKNKDRILYDIKRELETIELKSQEINLRGQIEKIDKERNLYEISQFIFDLFNQNVEAFGFMKNYHYNLGAGLGIKVGVMKGMFHNPYDEVYIVNKKRTDEKTKINNKNIFIETDIIKNCFLYDYKQWMDNLNNKDKSDIKLKPNIFRITLFNLLNNDNNININIPLFIINNYLIWSILHKLNIPKKILDHFQLHIFSNENNNENKQETNVKTPKNFKNQENNLYKNFIFDKNYLLNNYGKQKELNYNTNLNLIEKFCINLENKIILAKIELIYIELVCKNINSLCLNTDPNLNKIIKFLKCTSVNLIKLLINFLQIPESGFIESSFEETVCIYLKQMASNINDVSFYNQQLGNLTKIMEVIEWYETNETVVKANLVKNMILIIIYLINIIERLTKKSDNTIFKCLYKCVKYNLKDILEEKDKNKENSKRFNIFYKQKNKIIFYDELFLYQCFLDKEKNDFVEINDIEFIGNADIISEISKNRIIFKINNNIIIFFNNDDEGNQCCKKLEEKIKNLKDSFPKNYEKFNLNNILAYAEKL